MRRANAKRGTPDSPVAIDLFCGVGGMSLGFEQAGFHVAAGFDNDPKHVEYYAANFPDSRAIRADLHDLSGGEVRTMAGVGSATIAVVFAGPPCQGFSLIGRRDHDDPRSYLLLEFARLVSELQPSYFVIENVGGIVAGRAVEWLERFTARMESAGYAVTQPKLLNAADFGVPQNRRRVFVMGARAGLPLPGFPEPRSHDDAARTDGRAGPLALRPVVKDAIGDLPDIDDHDELLAADAIEAELGQPSAYARYLRGDKRDPTDHSQRRRKQRVLTGCLRTQHTAATLRRFRRTKQGEYEPRSRLYRLKWDGLAPTIRAGTDASRGSFMAARPIHPTHHRCISVREAARLHSFPDWFQFHPTKWHAFRQIGSAVPPLLARAVAQPVLNLIRNAPR